MKRFWILLAALVTFLVGCDSSYHVMLTTSRYTRWAISVQAGPLANGSGDTILVFEDPMCLKATRLTGNHSGPMTLQVIEWRSDFMAIFEADEVRRDQITVGDSLQSRELCW